MRQNYYLRNEGLLISLHDPYQWVLGQTFEAGELSSNDNISYLCIEPHTATSNYEPGTGANWQDVFYVLSVGVAGAQGIQGIPGGTLAWRGLYASGTAYTANDGIITSEGRACYALQVTTGNAPPSYPTLENAYWSVFAERGGIRWRGTWQISTNYIGTDLVSHTKTNYGIGVYVAKRNHTSSALTEPETGANWADEWEVYSGGGQNGTGDVVGPAATTENNIPQWDATTKMLKDGRVLVTTIGDPGADTAIPTEQAVREALLAAALDGWIAAGETWTYAAADAPSFTFTISGDKTTTYYSGMRIKITQTTIKYFIVTKCAYSSPNTTITIFGGSDFTLANATITLPFFSMMKAPAGFPLSPEKWSVTVSSTGGNQNSPVHMTWYNIASFSISVPVGVWNASYSAEIGDTASSSQYMGVYASLSTANNAETNPDCTTSLFVQSAQAVYAELTGTLFITAVTKTTYYLIELSFQEGAMEFLAMSGGTIKLYCAYL
jgi:hypothetical protein